MNNDFEKQECILKIGQSVGQIITGLFMTAGAIFSVISFAKKSKKLNNQI